MRSHKRLKISPVKFLHLSVKLKIIYSKNDSVYSEEIFSESSSSLPFMAYCSLCGMQNTLMLVREWPRKRSGQASRYKSVKFDKIMLATTFQQTFFLDSQLELFGAEPNAWTQKRIMNAWVRKSPKERTWTRAEAKKTRPNQSRMFFVKCLWIETIGQKVVFIFNISLWR